MPPGFTRESERQKWTFEHRRPLSCCRGIRKTSCLSNDRRGEPYLLQKLDRILGCGDTWAQPEVKDLWQLRILDKMEREKAWPQQVLQLDVVRGHEHLRVRTEGLEDCLAGGDSLRCVGTTKQFIDYKYSSPIALRPLHKGQDSFQLSEEVTLTRLDRMLRPNQGHDIRSWDDGRSSKTHAERAAQNDVRADHLDEGGLASHIRAHNERRLPTQRDRVGDRSRKQRMEAIDKFDRLPGRNSRQAMCGDPL